MSVALPEIPAYLVKGKAKGGIVRHPRLRKQRAMLISELALRGVPQATISQMLNMTDRHVRREMMRAVSEGWLEDVRKRLEKTADKAPAIMDEILDAKPEHLQKFSRAYKIKADLATTLTEGFGVLRKQTEKTETKLNLFAYHQQRQQAAEDTVDAEAVPQALPAYDDEDDDGA